MGVKVMHYIDEVREEIKEYRKQGYSIGLVPTMGYLHEGHLSLIKKAKEQNDKVVVSIFVNPTQFGPNEDLASYPRDLERDIKLCDSEGADIIFNPAVEEMYPTPSKTFVNVEEITDGLCGATRKGHFKGVASVVAKLFNIVKPDKAYFGQKDAQQLAVIKRMVKDLNMDIEIVGCMTVREEDNLAKSSRNIYLTPEQRKAATVLSKSLFEAKRRVEEGEKEVKKIKQYILDLIGQEPLANIEYVEIVDAENLQPLEIIDRQVLIALAVKIGKTRLIDNLTL
ncbi:MAG: pantoate--beta-alanine ligase [Peptostreptococcales bacterium]